MLDLHCYQTAYIVIVIINYKYYGSQCQYHIIFSLITQRLGGGLGGNNCIRFIILAISLSSKYENIALFILNYDFSNQNVSPERCIRDCNYRHGSPLYRTHFSLEKVCLTKGRGGGQFLLIFSLGLPISFPIISFPPRREKWTSAPSIVSDHCIRPINIHPCLSHRRSPTRQDDKMKYSSGFRFKHRANLALLCLGEDTLNPRVYHC